MMQGYTFIPVPAEPNRSRTKPAQMSLDRRQPGLWFGSVDLEVECERPVHVGSGHKFLLEDGRAGRAAARIGERLVVPGSSFKGAVRARFEAMTGSCALWAPRPGMSPSRSRPDVKHAHLDSDARAHPLFAPCSPEHVCPACALFGFQARQDAQRGRLTFQDLTTQDGVDPGIEAAPQQWMPRLHHIGPSEVSTDRGRPSFEVRGFYGRKVARPILAPADEEVGREQAVETIPRGTKMQGRLRLFNVTDEELGGLLGALGILPAGALALGGIKAYDFGRVRVTKLETGLRDDLRRPRALDLEAARAAFEKGGLRYQAGEEGLFEAMG